MSLNRLAKLPFAILTLWFIIALIEFQRYLWWLYEFLAEKEIEL